jgi:hypothetical protein
MDFTSVREELGAAILGEIEEFIECPFSFNSRAVLFDLLLLKKLTLLSPGQLRDLPRRIIDKLGRGGRRSSHLATSGRNLFELLQIHWSESPGSPANLVRLRELLLFGDAGTKVAIL